MRRLAVAVAMIAMSWSPSALAVSSFRVTEAKRQADGVMLAIACDNKWPTAKQQKDNTSVWMEVADRKGKSLLDKRVDMPASGSIKLLVPSGEPHYVYGDWDASGHDAESSVPAIQNSRLKRLRATVRPRSFRGLRNVLRVRPATVTGIGRAKALAPRSRLGGARLLRRGWFARRSRP